jgi:Rad51
MALENILYGTHVFLRCLQGVSDHVAQHAPLTASIKWSSSTSVQLGSQRTRTLGSWYVVALIYVHTTQPPKIIDSIMALFRVDFSGRGELSERQQKVC